MYASFIVAILVIEHPASIVERLHISSISWPSIFHAHAWKEFKVVTKQMIPVVQLSLQLMEKK
jgi:hypothetical protein